MAAKVIQNFWSAVRGSFAGLVASDASGATDDGVRLHADKADGALHVKSLVTPAGSTTPTGTYGTPGRLPVDYAEDLGGVTGTWHPLQGGVSVVRTIGAGPVTATAVGKVVTVASIIVGVTTIGDIQAAIAADAASAALLELQGTPADVVGAAYAGGAAHDLWTTGTIPAHVLVVLGPDGYYWPASAYNETALGHVAARVHDTDLQAALSALIGPSATTLQLDLADVALPAAVPTVVVPLLDVRGYRNLIYWVKNTGVNNITGEETSLASDAAATFVAGPGSGVAITPGQTTVYARHTVASVDTTTAPPTPLAFPFFRLSLTSAAGTTCRVCVVGKR